MSQNVRGRSCAIVLVPAGGELEPSAYLSDVTEDFVHWECGL